MPAGPITANCDDRDRACCPLSCARRGWAGGINDAHLLGDQRLRQLRQPFGVALREPEVEAEVFCDRHSRALSTPRGSRGGPTSEVVSIRNTPTTGSRAVSCANAGTIAQSRKTSRAAMGLILLPRGQYEHARQALRPRPGINSRRCSATRPRRRDQEREDRGGCAWSSLAKARVARAKGMTDLHARALPSSDAEGGRNEGDLKDAERHRSIRDAENLFASVAVRRVELFPRLYRPDQR